MIFSPRAAAVRACRAHIYSRRPVTAFHHYRRQRADADEAPLILIFADNARIIMP